MSNVAVGQSKKEIKKNGVSRLTEKLIENVNGKETETIESDEFFDDNGNTLSKKEFNKTGNVLRKEVNVYNKDNHIIESTDFGENRRVASLSIAEPTGSRSCNGSSICISTFRP